MAHGLYGYAVDIEKLEQTVGSKDLGLLKAVRKRFAGPIELNDRWLNAHASGQNLLSLDEALEWVVVAPPEYFEDRTTNVGYALEVLCYHLGDPIILGRAGRSALRDMTLAELTDMVESAGVEMGTVELGDGFDLKRGLLVRPIAGIEPLASYPGTGFLRRSELTRLAAVLGGLQAPSPVSPWAPLWKLIHEAAATGMGLATFYY